MSLANIINKIVETHESAVECVKGSQPLAYSLLCAFGSLGVWGERRPVSPEGHLQLLIFLLEEVIFLKEKVCVTLLNHQSIIRFTFSIAYLRCVCHWKRGYRRHFENGSYCCLTLFLLYLYRPAPILRVLFVLFGLGIYRVHLPLLLLVLKKLETPL